MCFIASIEFKDGSVVSLPLNCREYHAQKLQYVFSRTLDRSQVASCSVVESVANRAVYVPALKLEVL